jgi:hypothetical protein
MGLRIGAGFRPFRHVWIGASIPLGHARRLARHTGHAEGSLFDMLVGLVAMWVILVVLWKMAWG